jgi:hypothetical protein
MYIRVGIVTRTVLPFVIEQGEVVSVVGLAP